VLQSGVEVNQQCIEVYQELKLKKNKKFIIFCLSKDFKNIEVQETSDDPDYEVFLTKLPVDECRWAVYDLEYETAEGKRQKLVFISWCVRDLDRDAPGPEVDDI
jgi:cofilin